MTPPIPTITAHGAAIPVIGYGTSGMGEVTPEHVATALKLRYRHIDTALQHGTGLAACRKRGLAYTAYCPLGRGRLLKDPVLAEIARAKGKTIAQVALRWLIQKGIVIPIPRSSNPARMAENIAVFDFALSDDEVAR